MGEACSLDRYLLFCQCAPTIPSDAEESPVQGREMVRDDVEDVGANQRS